MAITTLVKLLFCTRYFICTVVRNLLRTTPHSDYELELGLDETGIGR
jgi:hypothetical protein